MFEKSQNKSQSLFRRALVKNAIDSSMATNIVMIRLRVREAANGLMRLMATYEDIHPHHNDPPFGVLKEALSVFTGEPMAVPIHKLGPEDRDEVLSDIRNKIQLLDTCLSASTHESLSAVKAALYEFKATNTTIVYPNRP